MDDVKASEGTTSNNEVETGQQSDDAIKPPCPIYDLSNEESLTSAAMDNTFKAALCNSQKQERMAAGSQHFSGDVASLYSLNHIIPSRSIPDLKHNFSFLIYGSG